MLRPESFWFVLVAAFVPFALVGYPVAGLLLAFLRGRTEPVLRRWVDAGIVLAVAGAAFHAVLLAPAFVGEKLDGEPDLVVMSLNLRLGYGDAAATVELVRDQKVQVAVLEEVTAGLRDQLVAAGIRDLLPFEGGRPGPRADGTVVFSAYALAESAPIPLGNGSYRIKVAAPEEFWLVAAHIAQPLVAPGQWRADWSVLGQVLGDLDGAVVLAGDLNTTLDHPPLRDLLGRGFADAAQAANSGWQPTWPSGNGALSALGLPRPVGLIAIDHVLTRGTYGAVSTETFVVGGSDHQALVARLASR